MKEFLNPNTKYLIDVLKTCNDKEIESVINNYIRQAINYSKEDNEPFDYIGYRTNINANEVDYNNKDIDAYYLLDSNPMWLGFILDNVKIIYGCSCDENLFVTSKGFYYYMNNFDYLIDFAKYIKNKDIESDIDFLYSAYFFINNYLYSFVCLKRDNLHQLILDKNEKYFSPLKEHSILDFKNNGAGLCSEYSALLQNILSTFAYDTYYVFGTHNNSDHAFNIAIINNEYYLLDFSNGVNLVNLKFNKSRTLPYIMPLEDFEDNDLENFFEDEKEIELNDYITQIINETYFNYPINKKRVYKIQKRNLLAKGI